MSEQSRRHRQSGGGILDDTSANNFVLFLVIVVGIFSIFMFFEARYSELVYVTPRIDSRNSFLVRNRHDKQDAADMLAYVSNNLNAIIAHVEDHHPNHPGVAAMQARFQPSNVSESMANSEYTSYSVNKGEKIVFCLRSKDVHGALVDKNTMMFVAIHELAHLMSASIGHNDEFWNNMKLLLKCAIELHIYIYQDYRVHPQEYCGMTITDTPLAAGAAHEFRK
jgi:predicted metal-dependent hydrolase